MLIHRYYCVCLARPLYHIRTFSPLFPGDSKRSSSASPTRSEHASSGIRRPRQRPAAQQSPPSSAGSMGRMPAPTPTCTPTQTPTATPLQTPNSTPSRTPACLAERLASPISPAWMHGGDALPPVPSFGSRLSSSPAAAAAAATANAGARDGARAGVGAGAAAGPALGGLVVDLRSSLGKKGSNSDRMFDGRAGPFAGQCGPFGKGGKGAPSGDKEAAGGRGRGGRGSFEGRGKGGVHDGVASRLPEPGGGQDRAVRVMPSIDTEVRGVRLRSVLLCDASTRLRCCSTAVRFTRRGGWIGQLACGRYCVPDICFYVSWIRWFRLHRLGASEIGACLFLGACGARVRVSQSKKIFLVGWSVIDWMT